MDRREAQRAEATSNYQAFLADFPTLAANNKGGYAVYRNRRLIKVFADFSCALTYGIETYEDRLFSIQEITDEPVTLGGVFDATDTDTLRPGEGADPHR